MKKRKWNLLGIAIAGVLMVGCGSVQGSTQEKETSPPANQETQVQETETETVPEESTGAESEEVKQAEDLTAFEAPDLEGNTINQDVFAQADLTMVNVWATFCGPCLREMPELGEISQEYADQGVQIVGIVLDTLGTNGKIDPDMVSKAQGIVEQTKADYLHILPSEDLLRAGIGNIYSVPTTFFVDSNGNYVGDTYVGSRSKKEWIKVIEDVKASM